jgi:hypothetical protein
MCRGVTDHGSFTVVYICKNSFWRKMKCWYKYNLTEPTGIDAGGRAV